jgi:hypothetical protein
MGSGTGIWIQKNVEFRNLRVNRAPLLEIGGKSGFHAYFQGLRKLRRHNSQAMIAHFNDVVFDSSMVIAHMR